MVSIYYISHFSSYTQTHSKGKRIEMYPSSTDVANVHNECQLKYNSLRGQIPMNKSTWWESMLEFTNVKYPHGVLMMSTLFSGGTLHCSPKKYLESLRLKARDISKGVKLTDNEMVHNAYGFRLFFELDYRGVIPEEKTVTEHVRIAQNLVAEVFPGADNQVAVSVCDLKTKKKSDGSLQLAYGVHLVFSNIYTNTPWLKRIAMTYDTRLTRVNSVWSGVVDAAGVHSKHASLRPNFSYKVENCPVEMALVKEKENLTGSVGGNKNSGGKKRRKRRSIKNSYEEFGEFFGNLTDDEEEDTTNDEGYTLPESILALSKCTDCHNGKRLVPSVYRLKYFMDKNGQVLQKQQLTVYQELKITSLHVLDSVNLTTVAEKLPVDFAAPLDVPAPRNGGAVFSQEKSQLRAVKRRKNVVYLDPTSPVFPLVQNILGRVDNHYQQIAIQSIAFDKEYKTLTVNVKGRNCRHCLLARREHVSNRIYFVVLLNRGYVQTRCFDTQCTKIRETLFPKKKDQSVPAADRHLVNILNTKLPDSIVNQVCQILSVKRQGSSCYTKKQELYISPSTNSLLVTAGISSSPSDASSSSSVMRKKTELSKNIAVPLNRDNTLNEILDYFSLPKSERVGKTFEKKCT